MTTYTITAAQRHQLLDAVTASELDDVREVAEKMLQSLTPLAAPSASPADSARLDYVLTNGVPLYRDGKYRCWGVPQIIWWATQHEAIDDAIKGGA